ncbi:MAG TPA: Gfo/Idh/MocA family oxidoreductase [Acidobacteriota bacterium]|nr:Gfo/Idh/MocA family oxidoreductase [Acidobacteriota bacterium]
MLRIALIGAGHQGRNHMRFLPELAEAKLTLIVDRDEEKARHSGEELKVPFATHYSSHLDEFDAAILAVPTSEHFHIASELAEAGKNLLIEKPVTSTVEEAEALDDLVKRKGVVAHVGFPERYNPAVLRALPTITKPLFIETHRLGLFSPRSLDVDVVLDLMVHDLDLLYLILKEEPSDIEAVGVPVLSRNIDIANARLKFPGKCVVNLTASRVSAKRMRKMRLFQPYYYVSMDFIEQSVSMVSLQPSACAGGMPEISPMFHKPDQLQHPLQNEQIALRDAVLRGAPTGVSIRDAVPSLRMALEIKRRFEPVI